MRLVLFGDSARHAILLEDGQVRAAIRDVILGRPVTAPADPAPAIAGGLLARDRSRWSLGSRVIPAPEIDGEDLTRSVGAASEEVRARIPELRECSRAAGYADWPGISLLLIGGVLLDLFVGEELRSCGLVQAVSRGSRVWVLPDYSGPTVGMRCRHDPRSDTGAAIMWAGGQGALPGWPPVADISTWLHADRASAERAVAALRLRQACWLAGSELNVLRLRRGDPMWSALAQAARAVVAAAHQPLMSALPEDPDSRLMASRCIFEGVLGSQAAMGAVTVRAGIQTRLVWDGPDWQLCRESVQDGPDDMG